ncbi:cytochrome P450 [cyanobacterium endosymbiont of Rhopalodia gibberula]|uniref:cytochrome P450 n=1 Tax=cyanobacterium endosymbiont of Rhopalodia gibberula TaxID=1763363 RepID=UPI0011AB5461|nr:cytochrome P450 [cyanobacterium endosymbiont of Rhopalodia gibberula]
MSRTLVMGRIYLTLQREDLYASTREFRPERFLEWQYFPYEFIPFRGEVYSCLGEALAQFEIKLVLGTIVSGYQLKLLGRTTRKL